MRKCCKSGFFVDIQFNSAQPANRDVFAAEKVFSGIVYMENSGG